MTYGYDPDGAFTVRADELDAEKTKAETDLSWAQFYAEGGKQIRRNPQPVEQTDAKAA